VSTIAIIFSSNVHETMERRFREPLVGELRFLAAEFRVAAWKPELAPQHIDFFYPEPIDLLGQLPFTEA